MSLNSSNPAQFNRLSSRFSHSATLLFRSLSPPHKHLNLLHTRTAWLRSPKTQKFLSVGASLAPEPATYGGWEELGHVEDSVEQGEPAQLRRMLVSMGTDDQKYVFMFLSGLVCALAISRVRVSSILVFPACVSVFVIGFSFGLVRGGILAEVSGSKKVRSKEEVVKIYVESSRKFIGFLDELDTRMNRLRSDLHRAIDCNRVRLSDLENYAKEIQMVHSSVMNVRNDIGASIASIGNCGGSSAEKEKPSKKRKEEGNFGSPWLESIWSLFKGESLGGLKPNKAKDNVREDNVGNVVKDNPLESAPRVALDVSSSPKRSDPSQSRGNKPDGDRRVRRYMENGSMNFDEVGRTTRGYADIDGLNYRRERLHSLNGQYMYLRARHSHQSHSRESHDTMLHFEDFDSNTRHMETGASFMKDQLLEKSERYYTFPERRERCEVETYKSEVRIENKRSNEDFLFGDHQPEFDGDLSSSSSRTISEDVEFNRCLTRANSLLKQAKELARGGQDEEHAETILYESAELLSRAMAMKPKSLLAMGQLGNTYLLHGELKLRISRNLRTLLSSNNTYLDRQGLRWSSNGYPSSSKDEIASVLVQVCEECEELLIEAGRKYRQALSIDANDVRALYNWGLALSFRAQLIADIGPEAAFDADKVFLAAIDKFDAMMSKGNAYAPDALFRWGVALQERSRLRPRSSRDKVKLLEQAKRLYEDALDMDSDHPRVREALSSCILELNYKRLL